GSFVLTDGEYTLEYFAEDAAGLVEPAHTTTIRINTVAPITTASVSGTIGTNGWYTSAVSVTLNASDGTGGVSETFYRLDGGLWTVYAGPIVLSDGRRVLDYYATDVAGNREPVHSRSFSIDTAPPVASASLLGTVGANTWYVSNVTVTLDASDATSGVAGIRYRIDGGPWQPYGGPFMLGPGRHSVDVFAFDAAGLWSLSSTTKVEIDIAGPTTVDGVSGIAGENGWYVSYATVTLTASDPGSGVASTAYRLDGGTWIAYAGPFSISRGGRHILEFASVDKAGNRGPIARDSVDGALVGGAVAVVAFRVWRGRRGPNTESR